MAGATSRDERVSQAFEKTLVYILDADANRRERVSQVCAGRVEKIVGQPQFPSAEVCLALVALTDAPTFSCPEVRSIMEWARLGVRVIAYADLVDHWPVGARCIPLSAGASALLASDCISFQPSLCRELECAVKAFSARQDADEAALAHMRAVGIVARSRAMVDLFYSMTRVAQLADIPVLVTGETGTGKQLVAESIHALDPQRKKGPFVAVNCAAFGKDVAKSELFGHRRGAFTGALEERKGLFRAAEGGVLFLDEVGELDLELQAALLRVLQERRVLGVGEERETPVNVRVVAATNRDLPKMVEAGTFRRDLYHRLDVASLHILPLRERPADIEPLVRYFLEKHHEANHCLPIKVSDDFVQALSLLDLFGNARELEHVVLRAICGKHDGTPLDLCDLPCDVLRTLGERYEVKALNGAPSPPPTTESNRPPPEMLMQHVLGELLQKDKCNLASALSECEKVLVETALTMSGGSQTRAARLLDITPRSVYNKLRKHKS